MHRSCVTLASVRDVSHVAVSIQGTVEGLMKGYYTGAFWNCTGMWTYSARQTHSHSALCNNDACCSLTRSQVSSRVSIGAAHSRADMHDT